MIKINGTADAITFFKDLLCVPKRFVRMDEYAEWDEVVFHENINKIELYSNLRAWLDLRIP